MPNGSVIWEGPSRIDGKPVVVIATGWLDGDWISVNAKTGPMLQTYILRQDIHPTEALSTGDDVSVCGDCPLRPRTTNVLSRKGLPGYGGRVCYVRMTHVVTVWTSYRRGAYPHLTPAMAGRRVEELGMSVRLGAYGDPGAVPLYVWDQVVAHAPGWTGYTHRWRHLHPAWQRYVMASCDSIADREEASAKGWRTFRIGDSLGPNEIFCPADHPTRGKLTSCDKCQLCDGVAVADTRKDLVIPVHGIGARIFARKETA